jgi:hypothetical protein
MGTGIHQALDPGRKPAAAVITSIISGTQILHKEGILMDRNFIRWSLDVIMAVAFTLSFVTGMLKFTLLLRMTGLGRIILPSAGISDLHDWSSVLLGVLVFVHLYLNRAEIMAMTKKVIAGKMSGK